jgi:prephenate dehydratase
MSKLHALGPAGSYSSLAAHHVTKTTGNDFEIVYEESLVNIIPKVNCEAYAIVPIENRYGGVVADTMNTLYQYRNAIRVIGWVNLAIHHCLAMRSDGDKDPA